MVLFCEYIVQREKARRVTKPREDDTCDLFCRERVLCAYRTRSKRGGGGQCRIVSGSASTEHGKG